MDISDIVDFERHAIDSEDFQRSCRKSLDEAGVLTLTDFIRPSALSQMQREAAGKRERAYFCTQEHSVYLEDDDSFPLDHPANRRVISSKGCICHDDVPDGSPLRRLYDNTVFRDFVMMVTGQGALHPYADPLSSINIHYAERGQELGWHFDNSSFAITLLVEKPDAGSRFEYVKDLRDAERGEMNYDGVSDVLDGVTVPDVLDMDAGTLVLFRGRNSLHRVTPNEGDKTRVLAVLAYNAEPNVSLSESARMTFYGRLT